MRTTELDIAPRPTPKATRTPPSHPATAAEVADFQIIRPRLFGIAYRMLHQATDAEDVVQEVWIRWQRTDRELVRDRVSFLVRVATRCALNAARTARARREFPVEHLPVWQTLVVEGPTSATERADDLACALALLLQRLSPTERAVFVLREAFDYPFRDIAEALELSEANSRQLARRARAHLAERRETPVRRVVRDRWVKAFVDAARIGAVARLERLLADDVLTYFEHREKR